MSCFQPVFSFLATVDTQNSDGECVAEPDNWDFTGVVIEPCTAIGVFCKCDFHFCYFFQYILYHSAKLEIPFDINYLHMSKCDVKHCIFHSENVKKNLSRKDEILTR